MESTKEFLLSTPVFYSKEGHRVEVMCVTLVAPSKKLLRKSYTLQQYLTKALLESQKLFSSIISGNQLEAADDDEKKEQMFEKKQVFQVLLASSVDIEECFAQMERLALAGAVQINDKKITLSQWTEITEEDKEGLLAEYVSNFIISLVMNHLSES